MHVCRETVCRKKVFEGGTNLCRHLQTLQAAVKYASFYNMHSHISELNSKIKIYRLKKIYLSRIVSIKCYLHDFFHSFLCRVYRFFFLPFSRHFFLLLEIQMSWLTVDYIYYSQYKLRPSLLLHVSPNLKSWPSGCDASLLRVPSQVKSSLTQIS